MNIWSKSSTVTSIFSLWISSVPSKNLVNVSSSAFNTSTSRGLASVSVSELVSFVLNEGVSIAVKRFGVDDVGLTSLLLCGVFAPFDRVKGTGRVLVGEVGVIDPLLDSDSRLSCDFGILLLLCISGLSPVFPAALSLPSTVNCFTSFSSIRLRQFA
ncbi:hypothetical protein NP493_3g01063 [Ridgeia piscesae]|uniref:Uncharacterized protein n=1 Tax=Ridgeia piscesae TaxID=27915 RepID=A0AAD9PG68_RIDPI|nr:hypothetical protein NP493_3g01063 [Ridgeia piscesae]